MGLFGSQAGGGVTTWAQIEAFGDFPSSVNQKFATFGYSGTLALSTGAVRWYPPAAMTVTGAQAWVSTAPTGAAVNFAIKKNGSSLFTGSISDGSVTMTPQTGLNHALLTTDYLTVDITQVGSTVAGENLSIRLVLE